MKREDLLLIYRGIRSFLTTSHRPHRQASRKVWASHQVPTSQRPHVLLHPKGKQVGCPKLGLWSLTVGTGGWGHAGPMFRRRRGCREERPSPRRSWGTNSRSQCCQPPPASSSSQGPPCASSFARRRYTGILRHDHHLEAGALHEAREVYIQNGPNRGLEILHEPKQSNNKSWAPGLPSSNPVVARTSTAPYATAASGTPGRAATLQGCIWGRSFAKSRRMVCPSPLVLPPPHEGVKEEPVMPLQWRMTPWAQACTEEVLGLGC